MAPCGHARSVTRGPACPIPSPWCGLASGRAWCRVRAITGIEIDRLVATVPGGTLIGAVARRCGAGGTVRRRQASCWRMPIRGVSGRDEVSAAMMGGSIASGAAAPLYCPSTRSRSCRPGTISAVPVVPASASAARVKPLVAITAAR